METPHGDKVQALERMSDAVEPEEVEALLSPYTREGWSLGDETCSECGSDDLSRFDLELEAMLDDDAEYGPRPARVVCEGCETLLYEHPKWRAFEIFGDEYAYTQV